MVDIKEVAENIYMIDNQLYSIPEWGSVYLIKEEKKALIDTGPTTSVKAVLDGIKKAGVRPADIDYIIVTHVHLDHAGGTGVLIKDMPRAQVIVHHRGARHLVNPEKLVSSIMAVQGKEAMAKNGEVVPIEEHRATPIYGGEVINLSEKQVLKFIDAPGHASHEICIYESRNNGVFTGDAAGISVGENEILLPSSPAPNFDSELCVDTLDRLMKLKATKIYFGHFGVSNKVQENLRLAVDKLQIWNAMVTGAVRENRFDNLEERMMAQAYAKLETIRETGPLLYEHLTKRSLPMSVAGFIKDYQEKHGVELSKRRSGEGN